MPSTLVRLAVALITFGLGVSATMFWIAYTTPDVNHVREANFIKILPLHPHTLPPAPPLSEVPPAPLPMVAPISGGALEGRALSKPAPIYPPIANAARAYGIVRVQVTVDEEGNVMSAKAISGHPLLRTAAVEAAYQARLIPAVSGGETIKFSGTLSYYFASK